MNRSGPLASLLLFAFASWSAYAADSPLVVKPATPAQLFPLGAVRLLPSPFADAVVTNPQYLLAHDPDRLLAPFMREAGLEPRKPPYPNWESMGLQGHTAGHYLSALSQMIATGNDPDGEFSRQLDYMLSEMEREQQANGNGYIGGVPVFQLANREARLARGRVSLGLCRLRNRQRLQPIQIRCANTRTSAWIHSVFLNQLQPKNRNTTQ